MGICGLYPLVVILFCFNDLKAKLLIKANGWLIADLHVTVGREWRNLVSNRTVRRSCFELLKNGYFLYTEHTEIFEVSSYIFCSYTLTGKYYQKCHPSHRCLAHDSASLYLEKRSNTKLEKQNKRSHVHYMFFSRYGAPYQFQVYGRGLDSQVSWCTVSSGSESGPLCSTQHPLQYHWNMLQDKE